MLVFFHPFTRQGVMGDTLNPALLMPEQPMLLRWLPLLFMTSTADLGEPVQKGLFELGSGSRWEWMVFSEHAAFGRHTSDFMRVMVNINIKWRMGLNLYYLKTETF
jgi:hypothetical protein